MLINLIWPHRVKIKMERVRHGETGRERPKQRERH